MPNSSLIQKQITNYEKLNSKVHVLKTIKESTLKEGGLIRRPL